MPGYIATSATPLPVVTGAQLFTTQSALSYVASERVMLTYALDSTVFMAGTILSYDGVTGSMLVDIDTISGIYSLQPIFNTQPWAETTSGIFTPWNLSLLGQPAASTTTAVPTITVRRLDSNWDPQRGQSLSNFLSDGPAVAQIISTTLQLLQGEVFTNTSTGTPLFQSLLGQSVTLPAVGLILRERILSVPYVTGINSFTISSIGRNFVFTATVATQFGAVTVSNNPQS